MSGSWPKPGGRLLFSVVLLLLGTTLGIGAAEGIVRLVSDEYGSPYLSQDPRVPDPVYYYRLAPGATARHRAREFDVVYQINSLGVRGREYTLPKPLGTLRILLLGDSFTFGHGVPWEKTVGEHLEGLFAGSVEVVNGGVSAFSPILEYLRLKALMPLEPDLVVVTIDMGNAYRDYDYSSSATFDGAGLPLAVPAPPELAGEKRDYGIGIAPASVRAWLAEHSALYRLLRGVFRRFFPPRGEALPLGVVGDVRQDLAAPARPHFPLESEAWALSQRYVLAMRDFLAVRQIPLVAVINPWGNQVSSQEWDLGRNAYALPPSPPGSEASFTIWQRFGEREGIPVLSLLEAFRQSGRKPLYYRHDGHWTANGHQVAAEALYRFLWERNLVPGLR